MVSELVGKVFGGMGGVDEHVWVPAVDRVGVVKFCVGQLKFKSRGH